MVEPINFLFEALPSMVIRIGDVTDIAVGFCMVGNELPSTLIACHHHVAIMCFGKPQIGDL